MNHFARVLATFLLLVPMGAAAMTAQTWDFRGNANNWQATNGLGSSFTDGGLRITAETQGAIYTETLLDGNPDALRVYATTNADTELKFLWEQTAGASDMVELPFIVRAGEPFTDVDLRKWEQWNPRTSAIGIAFPQGADVTIRGIELRRWGLLEKAEEALFSAWTFDTFRAYSINFLWGPLIVTSPVARAELFANLPPFGLSLNDVFYALMAIAGLGAFVASLAKHPKKRACLTMFIATVAGCWLVYDLRMSAEILSYAATDLRTHVFAKNDEKEFRMMEDFWPMLEHVRPLIGDGEPVVFVTDPSIPALAYVRYALYPTPVVSMDAARDIPATWVLYRRTDAALDPQKRLTLNGVAVSASGTIVDASWPGTVVFRTHP